MKIQGRHVHFGVQLVNEVHLLQDADMSYFEVKGHKLGTWMANILIPNKEVSWATTKKEISM